MRHDIDDCHEKWYKAALELARILAMVEVVPRVCSKQTLRENYSPNSSSVYYKQSLTIPLVDTVLGELKRGFKFLEEFSERITRQCKFYVKVNNLSEFPNHEKSFENFGNNVCHIMHL